MKKLLCLILMAMFLFTGCEKAKEENVQKPEIEQVEVREFTFLDEKKLIEGTENLSYVPNDVLENASFPNIYGLGDNLLVVSYPEYFGEDGTPEIQQLELSLVSLADGSLLATERIPTMGSEIQILQGHLVVSDGYHGTVDIFNEKLELTLHCELGSNDMNNFCMSEDLEHLYISNWDVGIDLYEMSSAKREEALVDEKNVYVTRDENLHLYCHYTNLNTQQNEIMCIDLQTGEQELVPLDLDKGFNCARYEEYWLVQSNSDMRKYYYCTPDAQKVVYVDGIELRFKDDKIQLFDERSMRFYDLDGKYETGFLLPEDNLNYINSDLVWNDHWDGYFLVENREEGPRLIFWNPKLETKNADLEILVEEKKNGQSVSEELYQRANEISEHFGVDIRIADLCQESYAEYTCSFELDEEIIKNDLNSLEQFMLQYPDGFFEQLRYEETGPLRIELVTNLQRDDGVSPSAAFTWGHIIVFDSLCVTDFDFYHEISHVVDQKLAFNANLREDAKYNEETWLSLQPEGFEYSYSYLDYWDLEMNYDYFVSQYSMTFPTEDRAELLQYAMQGSDLIKENAEIYKKLEYYCECIRECFDTSGWPEKTLWEQML